MENYKSRTSLATLKDRRHRFALDRPTGMPEVDLLLRVDLEAEVTRSTRGPTSTLMTTASQMQVNESDVLAGL